MSTLCPRTQLHPSLPEFSRLVQGCWRLADLPDTSPRAVLDRIHAALSVGITTFDHADIYGDHRCEALFGAALAADPALRGQLQHVSKCDILLLSRQFPERRVKHYDTTPAHIRASVHNSLQRLGVERLDLLLLHRPDPLMDADATAAALDALVDQGDVAAIGVSNFLPHDWQLLASRLRHPLVTNQIELSLLARQAFTDGQLAFAQQHRIQPMAWSPLGGGGLMRGQGEAAQRLLPLMQGIGQAQGVGPEAVALAWLLAHPVRALPVVGTLQPERIARLAEAWRVQLDRQTWFELWTAAEGREVP